MMGIVRHKPLKPYEKTFAKTSFQPCHINVSKNLWSTCVQMLNKQPFAQTHRMMLDSFNTGPAIHSGCGAKKTYANLKFTPANVIRRCHSRPVLPDRSAMTMLFPSWDANRLPKFRANGRQLHQCRKNARRCFRGRYMPGTTRKHSNGL